MEQNDQGLALLFFFPIDLKPGGGVDFRLSFFVRPSQPELRSHGSERKRGATERKAAISRGQKPKRGERAKRRTAQLQDRPEPEGVSPESEGPQRGSPRRAGG